jgi:hypothetical protein
MANSAATKKPFRETRNRVINMSKTMGAGVKVQTPAKDWNFCEGRKI